MNYLNIFNLKFFSILNLFVNLQGKELIWFRIRWIDLGLNVDRLKWKNISRWIYKSVYSSEYNFKIKDLKFEGLYWRLRLK